MYIHKTTFRASPETKEKNRLNALKFGFQKGHKAYTKKGRFHPNWKGDNASYQSIHMWLKLNYGKPNRCESKKCKGISKKFEYALIKGKKHQHKRSNYKMLCKSCHNIYDGIGGANPVDKQVVAGVVK